MSHAISPSSGIQYGLKRVCAMWDISRSTYYAREKRRSRSMEDEPRKSGPKPKVSDSNLLIAIKEDLSSSPFRGEGHRKVHARLKRRKVTTGRNRVLRIMKENNLPSPLRNRREPQSHDGKIITDQPNQLWCSDGTKLLTVEDGWVWLFSVEEHWNAECLGWHVCKIGDRFAALEPITQAVKKTYGSTAKGVASGLVLRIDNGAQYTSDYFLKQIEYLGIQSSFGLIRQPQTNGVAERFNRTLKDQILDGRIFRNIDEVREVVGRFVALYNEQWLLQKLGYKSPLEARQEHQEAMRAA